MQGEELIAAQLLYKTFALEEGKVFGATCCGRLYLGRAPATTCRVCKKAPDNIEITSEADLARLGGSQ